MRIGILTYDFDPPIGGLGHVVRQYLQRQKLSEKDAFVVLSPSPNADDRVSTMAAWRWKKSGGCPLFSLAVNLVLNTLVRNHELDVLHVHAGSGGVFLLRKPSCPLVVTSHHTYLQEAHHVFTGASRMWKYFMSLLERRTYALADRITCVSKDTADALAEDYGVPRQKMTVIENGVDAAYMASYEPLHRDEATVLFVGRLEERKGVLQLLAAFKDVVTKVPAAKLRLIGSNLLGDSIHAAITGLGLSQHVELLGFVPETQRIDLMRRASMVVVPSVLEGFGLVAAEAMSLGCPLIVTDCPGLRSLVDDGKTGVIVPCGETQVLGAEIVHLLQEKDRASRLAEAARREASSRFRYERGVAAFHQVYLSAVQAKNN